MEVTDEKGWHKLVTNVVREVQECLLAPPGMGVYFGCTNLPGVRRMVLDWYDGDTRYGFTLRYRENKRPTMLQIRRITAMVLATWLLPEEIHEKLKGIYPWK